MSAALALAGAYLLGSAPFSYLVAKGFGVADVRRVGSGNVGATNVMRSAGVAAGLIAFALDATKGAAAVVAVRWLDGNPLDTCLAAGAAVVGHMYPVWLRFQGGKGVATGAGAFFPLAPGATGLALAVFAVILGTTRYVSLASIAGTLTLAVAAFLRGAPRVVAWTAAGVGLLVIFRHRSNLRRVLQGTERRLGARAKA